jgi:hypothetical protein
MVQLTNNTLEIIERSDKKVLGNILNNDNTISGNVTTKGFFIGDGSQLTNLNANLTSRLEASFNDLDVSGNLTVLSSLNGNSATFTANVTAANFIGDLSGNVSGTVSSLSNFTKSNVDFEEVTASNFIGNIIGYNNLNIESTGSIDINSANTMNIISYENLIMKSTQSIDISSTTVNLTNLDIRGNLKTSTRYSMTARIDDGPDSWYVVMYNQRTKQLKFGTPPYT